MITIGIECESIEDGESWGIARIINKFLSEIDRRPELKNEFRFALYFKSKIPDYPYLKNDIFVKHIVTPRWLPSSFSLYYYVWLPMRLWFARCDVMYFPNYMLPILFRGTSLVTLTEDAYYEMTQGQLPFRYRLAYRIFSVWAARHATKIITVLQSSKPKVAQLFGINPDRIVIVPNGIEKNTSYVGHPLISGEYIFYLGQAFPRRHLRETLFAFEKISPRFPDLRFVVVGRDKYNPPIIRKLIADIQGRLGKEAIIYKDYIDQKGLEDAYAGAKACIYVADPDIEAFGLPPLEALSYGVAPIVTAMDATRLIFGNNAFFVTNPSSVDEIAAVMTEAITNESKRREIISHAQEVVGRYTWQKHTDAFLDVVRDMTHA